MKFMTWAMPEGEYDTTAKNNAETKIDFGAIFIDIPFFKQSPTG